MVVELVVGLGHYGCDEKGSRARRQVLRLWTAAPHASDLHMIWTLLRCISDTFADIAEETLKSADRCVESWLYFVWETLIQVR